MIQAYSYMRGNKDVIEHFSKSDPNPTQEKLDPDQTSIKKSDPDTTKIRKEKNNIEIIFLDLERNKDIIEIFPFFKYLKFF